MMASFRLRLFLSACGIVMVVVTVVMGMGWTQFMQFETARLDARLCSEARRLAMERFPSEELPRLETDIQVKLQLGSTSQLRLKVISSEASRTYQSQHWEDVMRSLPLHVPPAPQPNSNSRPPPPPGERPPRPANDCALASFASGDHSWRSAVNIQDDTQAIVAADLSAPRQEIRKALLGALAIVVPLALALSAAGAVLLSAMMMRPVNRLRDSMRRLTPRDLAQRLPEQGQAKEFRDLIAAYNDMLERLERSFKQASRFSADAAHELKTPLTILRGRIEQALRQPEAQGLQMELSALMDEVGRLSAITRKLLLLSQADAGRLEINRDRIDFTELLQAMVADISMVIEDRDLHHSIAENLVFHGDTVLIQQLLNNLFSNALRYTPPAGTINVRAKRQANQICLEISNTSNYIGDAQRQRFFERFYRVDDSHNRKVDGNGLGLSLAREIAVAHGGNLVLSPTQANIVCLILTLPAA